MVLYLLYTCNKRFKGSQTFSFSSRFTTGDWGKRFRTHIPFRVWHWIWIIYTLYISSGVSLQTTDICFLFNHLPLFVLEFTQTLSEILIYCVWSQIYIMVPSFLFFTAFGKYFEVVSLGNYLELMFSVICLLLDMFCSFSVSLKVSSTDTLSFDFDLDHLQVIPHCQLANAYAVENVCN